MNNKRGRPALKLRTEPNISEIKIRQTMNTIISNGLHTASRRPFIDGIPNPASALCFMTDTSYNKNPPTVAPPFMDFINQTSHLSWRSKKRRGVAMLRLLICALESESDESYRTVLEWAEEDAIKNQFILSERCDNIPLAVWRSIKSRQPRGHDEAMTEWLEKIVLTAIDVNLIGTGWLGKVHLDYSSLIKQVR